jgi:hypothetical protein
VEYFKTNQQHEPVIEQLNIPGLFRQVATAVSDALPFPVYFDYGAYDVVNKNLQSLDQSITMKDRKYPLIWLVTPIREVITPGADYACDLQDIDILICVKSDATSSNDERNAASFATYLRPIYHELLRQIDSSYLFTCTSMKGISHEVREWPYHSGVESASGKVNLFNDFIDCIQIRRLRLQVNHSQNFVNS